MKKTFLCLLLAGALLLSGCSSLLERSDVSATAHVDYSVTEDSSILRVESYPELVSSILYFANERAAEGTVRLYNYTGNVEDDLADACQEVMTRDPLCAFSLEDISFDSTRILTYYEVDITFSYSRTADEVEAIREVVGISELRDELAAMVDGQETRLTLMVSYFSGTEDLVWQLLTLARYSRPELYKDPGGAFTYEISMYPETGSRRIVDIRVDNWGAGYHASAGALTSYSRQLQEAADSLLEASPPADTFYTVEELVAILRIAAGGYDYHGTHLALGTLNGAPAYETGYMLALEYLCQRSGIEVIPVLSPPSSWLIVAVEDGYRHLLPVDIFAHWVIRGEEEDPYTPEELQAIPLYTDEELQALGYTWARSLYPVCQRTEEPEPPVPEESPTPEGSPLPEASDPPETGE